MTTVLVAAAAGEMLSSDVRLRVAVAAFLARYTGLSHVPRTTMRYDRARKNLDRHPNYTLAAFMASGT